MAFLSCFSCFKPVEDDIRELNYEHSSLEDVPNEIFAYERTLESLFLNSNNIKNLPRPLFQCHGLAVLNLSDNDISHLPDAISCLAQLLWLDLSKNSLTDIPDSIKQCRHLQILDVSVNPLQKIPEGCTQLLSITELYLNDTFLEFLPANFGRLIKLRKLELRDNAINSLPKSLSRLTQLERLDLGQNDVSEIPEVIGTLTNLTELWLDGNIIGSVPPFIGNLARLFHLELSSNNVEIIAKEIGGCRALVELCLSTNILKSLPDSMGKLEALVTLKIDDNQLSSLPNIFGSFRCLEELYANQNYLESLPPSLGLCRQLHTLNVDNNDLEVLPKELGSCSGLRILSAHGNRLTSLPPELDHLTNLAVINVSSNMIQNLPVSFVKLKNLTALWLSDNQSKPLVRLHQDIEADTGCRVLTNFLLPQQDQMEQNYDRNDADSEGSNSSFQAAMWEELRQKKSVVKWALDDDRHTEGNSHNTGMFLKRVPTPFPKEMRAMSKRVENVRSRAVSSPELDDKKYKKMLNETEEEFNGPQSNGFRVVPREAHVIEPHKSPVLSEHHLLSLYDGERELKEQIELARFEEMEKALSCPVDSLADISEGEEEEEEAEEDGYEQFDTFSNSQPRLPSDPLPHRPMLDDVTKKPPPYHVAAVLSKRANEFSNHEVSLLESSNRSVDRHPSSSASESSSSLQTIVRAPIVSNTTSVDDDYDEASFRNHAHNLRKVSELMLGGNTRNRHSLTQRSSDLSPLNGLTSSSGDQTPTPPPCVITYENLPSSQLETVLPKVGGDETISLYSNHTKRCSLQTQNASDSYKGHINAVDGFVCASPVTSSACLPIAFNRSQMSKMGTVSNRYNPTPPSPNNSAHAYRQNVTN